jgi:general L-amino acid transport system substrate-binding protein
VFPSFFPRPTKRALQLFCTFCVIIVVAPRPADAAETQLRCGIIAQKDDWNKVDQHGDLSAFNSEICRAIAAAKSTTPRITAYPQEEAGLQAVHRNDVDIVVGVTPGISAAARNQVRFGPTIFYDPITILGAPPIICVAENSDAESLLTWHLAQTHQPATTFPFQEEGEMESAFLGHRCTGLAATFSRLVQIRATYAPRLATTAIAPETLALIPLSFATPETNPTLAAIAAATINALLQAEEAGITHSTAPTWRDDGNIQTERLMGTDSTAARALGLPPDWARHVVATVGNYAELFAHTLGQATPRRENALPANGGLLVPTSAQ